VIASAKRRLADLLMGHATRRLRGQRPDWAEAMKREGASLASDDERLRWSSGCIYASYRTSGGFNGIAYPAALVVGVALMSAYQWSADESLGTVAALCLIGFALGLVEPRRNLMSGIAIGAVVAAVNSFETLTGVRPAYETRMHSLLHDARWTFLIAPAFIACLVGGYVGGKLRSDSGVRS
jgi:hypothetical protein